MASFVDHLLPKWSTKVIIIWEIAIFILTIKLLDYQMTMLDLMYKVSTFFPFELLTFCSGF